LSNAQNLQPFFSDAPISAPPGFLVRSKLDFPIDFPIDFRPSLADFPLKSINSKGIFQDSMAEEFLQFSRLLRRHGFQPPHPSGGSENGIYHGIPTLMIFNLIYFDRESDIYHYLSTLF
jgi:hypothetical protein